MSDSGFKPFGDHFEIKSCLSVDSAKAAIRSKKKSWFEPKDGPRGWIVGPVMCLWRSALNEQGPMLVALIKHDEIGTKITGRAGADLNGTALFVLLTPLMMWLTWKMYETEQGTTQSYVVIGLLFGLGFPLTLWINSADRGEAAPLAAFLRKAVQASKEA